MKKLINKLMSMALAASMVLSFTMQLSADVANTSTWQISQGVTRNTNGTVNTAIQYDTSHNVQSITYYNAAGQPAYATDSNGNVMTAYAYDSNGNALSQTVVNGDGSVSTTVILANGVTVTVLEAADGKLSSNGTVSLATDSNGNPIGTDSNGNTNTLTNITVAQVQAAYANIMNGTNNGTGSGSGAYYNGWGNTLGQYIQSMTMTSSAVNAIAKQANGVTVLNLLQGYHEDAVNEQDLTSVSAGCNTTFTFSYGSTASGGSNGTEATATGTGITQAQGMRVAQITYNNFSGTPSIDRTGVIGDDPAVTGKVEGVTQINGKYYVEVQASGIDMFNGKGEQSADGETILVAVSASTAANLQKDAGQEITISGNVSASADGQHLTMTENQGGFVVGAAGTTYGTWKSDNQSFYNNMVSTMIKTYDSLGVGNASWQQQWGALEGASQPNF